jgi:hypothetical protein
MILTMVMIDIHFVNIYLSGILGSVSRSLRVKRRNPSLLTARYELGPKPGETPNHLLICLLSLQAHLPSLSNLALAHHLPPFIIILGLLHFAPLIVLSPILYIFQAHDLNFHAIIASIGSITIHFQDIWTKRIHPFLTVPIKILRIFTLLLINHFELHPLLVILHYGIHHASIPIIPLHIRLFYSMLFEPFYLLNPTHHGSQVRLLLQIMLISSFERVWFMLRYDLILLLCNILDAPINECHQIIPPKKKSLHTACLSPVSTTSACASPSSIEQPSSIEDSIRLVSTVSSLPLVLNAHQVDFDPGFVAKLLAIFDDKTNIFKVVLDTGASLAITPFRDDFVDYRPADSIRSIETVNGPTSVIGVGIVRWVFVQEDGSEKELLVHCHHVPSSSVRLLSPQAYCAYHGFDRGRDQFGGNSAYFWMNTSNKTGRFSCPIEPRSNLPMALAKRACRGGLCPPEAKAGSEAVWRQVYINQDSPSASSCESCGICPGRAHLTVAAETNQNLTPSQRALLIWHWRLGHMGFDHLKRLFVRKNEKGKHGRCLVSNQPGIDTTPSPMCAACEIARAKLKSAGVTHTKVRPNKHQLLKKGHLHPGQCVSIDHYESSVRGRLPHTKGRESYGNQYVGGTIFADHASRYVACHHQVSLAGSDTVISKRLFERMAKENGVKIQRYHADNGHFVGEDFRKALNDCNQPLDLSGVGAHFQNGAAERAIGTVTEKARAMMHHSSLHWPEVFQIALWPFALDYACWLHNHTPDRDSGFAPIEIFASTSHAGDNLQRARVWGCPGYVLSPKLQDGKKIPKWAPKARRGQFLGFSDEHSSTVSRMRNLETHHVSPQFHVCYDEFFSTTHSVQENEEVWLDLFLHHREFYGPSDDEEDETIYFPDLDVGWLPLIEAPLPPPEPPPLLPMPVPPAPAAPINPAAPVDLHPAFDQAESLDEAESLEQAEDPISSNDADPEHSDVRRSGRQRSAPSRLIQDAYHTSSGHRLHPTPSSRSIFGYLTPFCHDDLFIHSLDWDIPFRGRYRSFESVNHLHVDPITDETEWYHPFSLGAKASSEDTPTLRQIQQLTPAEQDAWYESMEVELAALIRKETFVEINRSQVPKGQQICKSTWAFRRKRRPNGLIYKLKSRFVVRGDIQRLAEAEETFSPVVDWSTVRLLFILTAAQGLKTQTIDFNAAFVQAKLPEPLYLELPPGYSVQGQDKVYKVSKSLYGDVRAAKLWYKHLSNALVGDTMQMQKSVIDSCLYYRDNLTFIHYVDDGIIISNSDEAIERFITELQDLGFDLGKESDYAGYLGVEIKPQDDGSIHLTQTGLIDRILSDLGLSDSTSIKHVPAVDILSSHKESEPLSVVYNYRSVLGKMMYLSTNTRPDIAFANHQCARWSIDPREPHGVALKQIAKYLLKTRTKGMIMKPTKDLTLDCFADADFAGMFKRSDPNDPKSVKSRSGFVVTLGGIPVSWHSKLQSETALSTMESEYISLSQAMRVLLPMRLLLEEVSVALHLKTDPKSKIKSTIWEDNAACLTLASSDPPRMTPRSKSIAVKYHWFREHLIPGLIEVQAIGTLDQAADIFTKATPQATFERLRFMLLGW